MKDVDEDPTPDAEAVLLRSKNGSASLEDVAKPVADLKRISLSVLVDSPAEPEPVADLRFFTRRVADCVPVPEAVAVRSYIAGPM
jgi:hypothetical protein